MTIRGKVSIKIGDRSKARFLRYDHAALERLEEESGKTIDEHARRTAQGSALSLSWMLWAGLIHAEPELTRAQVSAMIDTRRYAEISEAIQKAQKVAFALGEEPEQGNDQAAD